MNTARIGLNAFARRSAESFSAHTFSRSRPFPAHADKKALVTLSPQSEKKVFFFHAMKTGGVTFRRILTSVYGDRFQVCYDPTAEAIEASLANAQAVEFHSFHFKGQLAHMHSGLTSTGRWDILEGHHCFTMLREPVDQAISLYYHLVRRRLLIEPVYVARGLHFPETIQEFVDDLFHFNVQTAFLADKHQFNNSTVATGVDLARAKDTLTRLKMHVGLTERFGDSMNVFENVTGRKIPGGVIHNENRNPDRPPVEAITQKLRDKIREQSGLDVELYEFGREMFLEDFSRCQQRRSYTFQDIPRGDQAVAGASAIRSTVPAANAGTGSTSTSPIQVARKVVFLHVMEAGGMPART